MRRSRASIFCLSLVKPAIWPIIPPRGIVDFQVDNHNMVMRSPHEVMGHRGHGEMSMNAMARDLRNRFLVAAVLSAPILLWSSIGRQVLHFAFPAPFGLRDDVFQLMLSLPVIGYSGWIF